MKQDRELLGSRLGFLLLSAGGAIGLGNVWRFPYITGEYGGAVFLLAYLFFLVFMGLPILVMEFAVGRASRRNMGHALELLQPKGTKWGHLGWITIVGSYLLMMFYIPVAGWMLSYMVDTLNGSLFAIPDGVKSAEHFGKFFDDLLASPSKMSLWALITSVIGFGVCFIGLRNGVERITKVMMAGLLVIMVCLAVYAITLPNAADGIAFYLKPDWGRAAEKGFVSLLNDAMGQAFFTLSLGIGSMCIFGSYLNKTRTLFSESIIIVCLDTFVAMTAGMIIFPTCFAFNVSPNAGPGLIFVTLPNVFSGMSPIIGRIFGTAFFVFLAVAALTTVIAVVENCVAYFMDGFGWSRQKSVIVNFVALTLLTLPCILGFNLLSMVQVPNIGGILDIEDFIVSNNLLPLGALIFTLFCTHSSGWGWKNFLDEADAGAGLKFPAFLRIYLKWILPIVLLLVFISGYVQKFFK